MSSNVILAIGMAAQVLFAGRMLVQWFLSEKEEAVVSPKIFWRLSLIASMLMCLYGWLRNDAAIIIGQLITYFIYIRNLHWKGEWKTYPAVIRFIIIALPIAAFGYAMTQEFSWHDKFIKDIPMWLMILGIAGQFIFTFRFIVQFYHAEKRKESVLPRQFWVLSVVGSALICLYGIFRQDIVLIIGNGGGLVAYVRNLMIGYKEEKNG